MNRRRFVVGGSASAVALTMAGLAAQRVVDAQDATPTPSTDTGTSDATQPATQETHYQEFVAALATALGVADAATVDTGIRTALKQLVDDEFAAGNISANDATARKERIDAAASPVGFAGGGGGVGGFGGNGGDRGGQHGGRDVKDGNGVGGPSNGGTKPGDTDQGETEPATEATPDAL